MRRVFAAFALAASIFAASAQAAQDDQIRRVHIVIYKLQESIKALKELDRLEASGMTHKDVERMRRALKHKLDAMIEEAIREIQKL
ncbi:MAG: hypothetical protein D6771_03575 [Zetaproteobacteria bacterium]|nr:MAG: hypothetical protein D6771_03575 [Zetaproteobacteria bacterium]